MIHIALIDDHDLMRVGLRSALSDDPEFTVVAEANNGNDGLQLARKHSVDVILLDINMPGGLSGIETLERLLKFPKPPRILMVSQHQELALIRKLLARGAHGYVSKTAGIAELKKAIRVLHRGGSYVSEELAQAMAFAPSPADKKSLFDLLSPREMEIAMAMVNGITNKESARRLSISEKTVSTFRSRLMEKLHIKTEAELVRLAIIEGLIPDAYVPEKPALSANSSD
jgi:two-component system, NarL family, invasion response regulator UvrY